MGIKTALIEIAKKVIKWDKKLEIYTNGEDNSYPERMERFKNNSVTASMASILMRQYLIGKGFGTADDLKIGGAKLIDIADDIAGDITDNKGVFIQVNYDLNFDISDFRVLPFNQCRVGQKDSSEYNGKILVYNDWAGKVDKSKVRIVDVFNPAKEIVSHQVEKAGGIEKYQGQILYFNIDSQYYYPLSRIDSVFMECDNEYQSSVYKNTLLRKGFFGKTLVVTRPLVDDSFILDAQNGDAIAVNRLREAESERETFKKTITDFIGAENGGGALHLEVDYKGENLADAILFKNIESNINDKLFEFTENSAVSKILMAYNNLPIILVKANEGVFGNSGESLRVAKETYWENTTKERTLVERIVNDLMRRKNDYKYIEYLSVIPLITPKVEVNANN